MQPQTLPAIVLPAIGALIHGGKFAGVMTNKAGQAYGFVLLDDKPHADYVDHKAAMAWAMTLSADLPTRPEAAQLFQLMPGEFAREWHWLNETCSWSESSAWGQYFYSGTQITSRLSNAFRARAVRRFPLESFSASSLSSAPAAASEALPA